MLIVNMPTIITSREFSDIHEYPEISKDLGYTIGVLKKLSFDIWVAAHASQFKLHDKHKPGDAYNPQVFVDRAGYDLELKELEAAYEKKLQRK